MTHATKFTLPMFYSDYFPPSTCRSYSTYSRQYIHSTKIIFVCQSAIPFKCFSNVGVQNISKITCSVQEVNDAGGLKPSWGRLISTREEHMNYPPPKKNKKNSNLRSVLKPWQLTSTFVPLPFFSRWFKLNKNIFQMTRDDMKLNPASHGKKKKNIKYQANVKNPRKGKIAVA